MRTLMRYGSVIALAALASCTSAKAQEAPPDWSPFGAAVGKPGKVLPDGTFRIDVPRTDPVLRNEFGFVVPPSMVLTYATFTGTPDDATVVGDSCSLGEEVNPVLDALRAGGLEAVAIHNHTLATDPELIFCHFAREGDAAELAQAVRDAWTPLMPPSSRR